MAGPVVGAVGAVGAVGGLRGGQTRRGLLAWSGWATMALVGLQSVVAFLFYFWPRKVGAIRGKVSVGTPEEYAVGDVRYFVDGKFYLARLEEGFMALSQKCPHLGCAVPWKAEEERVHEKVMQRGLFVCPCHGSTYLRNGQVIEGPAKRPMDYLPVEVEEGRLTVDTRRVVQRAKWDPKQALQV